MSTLLPLPQYLILQFFDAIEVFAKVLARPVVVSSHTKVKSLVSIPIPTIGNLIFHVDYCTKNC
jgi:hypothetical protein